MERSCGEVTWVTWGQKWFDKWKRTQNINQGQEFFSFICNHLPLLSIQYHRVVLQVKSDQDIYLTINLKGTILNDHIRNEVANYKYMYHGKEQLIIMGGMIGLLISDGSNVTEKK